MFRQSNQLWLVMNDMKQIRSYLVLMLVVVAALSMQAAAASSSDTTRLYVGGQLGDSAVGGILGLQINSTFSLEARYDYIDTENQPNTTIDEYCVGLTGIGMYPVKFGKMVPFYMFVKAGYEQTTTETTTRDPGIAGISDPTTTVTTKERRRTVVGAGVQFDFSRDFGGRIGVNAIGSDHQAFITAIYKF